MNLVKFRNWFFVFSLLVIIPGVIAFFLWGLKLGIDFSGGTLWEVKFVEADVSQSEITSGEIQKFLNEKTADVSSVAQTSANTVLIRMRITDEVRIAEIKAELNSTFGETSDLRLESVGAVISKELNKKAITAVALAIIAIVLYF